MTFDGPIGDLIEFAIGGGWGSVEGKSSYSEVAVIRGTDIPKVAMGDFATVPRRFESNKKLTNRLLKVGDIVLETAGGSSANGQFTGRTLLITDEILSSFGPTMCASFCKRLVLDTDVVEPGYFYWYMQDLYSSGRVALYDSQSTGISNFQFSSFLESEMLELPELATQKTLADSLSNLNALINLNLKLAKSLEEVAQVFFKSWFIDFDPVKAKMAGEPPVGMDDATAALFPDSMENSELGPIPSGWVTGTVSQICSILVNGSTPLRSNPEFWNSPDVEWFKTGELSDGFLLTSKELISNSALKGSSVKVLPKGSVLMAIYAAPTVGRLGILTHDSTFNQACTGMLAHAEFGMPYLFLQLKNRRIWFNSFAIGAAQQNISKSIVEQCPVMIAPNSVHRAFLAIAEPLFAEIAGLTAQSSRLVEIRDALLPRLISGELQIPEEMLVS